MSFKKMENDKSLKLKVWDNQRLLYFWDEYEFNNLTEIREALVDYHSIDNNIDMLSIYGLSDILEFYGWEIHNEKGEVVTDLYKLLSDE